MKVQELTGGPAIQKGSDVAREKASVKSNAFQDLLTEELDRKTDLEKDEGISLGGAGVMNAPVGMYSESSAAIYAYKGDDDMGMTTDAIHSLSGGLDVIDRSIGSGDASLKTVGEMIERLSQEAEGFRKGVDRLPSDHPLRQLSDQVGVLAYVESVKWKRGDYLS